MQPNDFFELLETVVTDADLEYLTRKIVRQQMQRHTGETVILPNLFFIHLRDALATDPTNKFEIIWGMLVAQPDQLITSWNDPAGRFKILYGCGRGIAKQPDHAILPVALFLLSEGTIEKRQDVMAVIGRTMDGRTASSIAAIERDPQDHILFEEAEFDFKRPRTDLLDAFYEGYLAGLQESDDAS